MSISQEPRRQGRQKQARQACAAAGLPPHALEIEITENTILRHEDEIIGPLQELRALGVGVAFDDYGTGHASLSMLTRFPVSRLKIDRSFTKAICESPSEAAIVHAIIGLACALDLRVTAEGIETSGQAEALSRERCDEGQGYFFGKPMSAADFARSFGIGPWVGLLAAVPVAAACGAIIGFLAFRFGVAGVYFAILTIAFADFARIGFDHLAIVNASAGLFLPVTQLAHNDLWRLRGSPTMFYYVILAATVFALILSRLLLRSRMGYFWLAIREDEQAARAAGIDTFRYKMYAVMISAAVTSFAGVFYAFFYNNLFPEQVFNISRSIEMILGPIIGGIGTLFGPILGAFVLTGLAESVTSAMAAFGLDLPGAKQIFYGVCLLLVVVALPEGIWPSLARRLGVGERER